MCRPEGGTMTDDYYRTHPEIWKEAQRKAKERYATDPEYRAKRRASFDKYAQANPEKRKEKDKRVKAARRSQPWGKLDYILRNARGRARTRGMVFEDAALELAFDPPVHCKCCGVELAYEQGTGQNPRSPSIDRVNSSEGYTVENIAIICMRCNGIKGEGNADEHRRAAVYIDLHAEYRRQLALLKR